jgi:hypothetical protein
VIHFAEEMEVCQPDSQLLLLFATNSLLGAVALVDAAAESERQLSQNRRHNRRDRPAMGAGIP